MDSGKRETEGVTTLYWGRIPYAKAIQEMQTLRETRLAGKIGDHLLFCEHDPVITMGRQESEADLKGNLEFLKNKGIEFIKTDRGGRLTYHGPGQLVGYFIFDLRALGLSIDRFVWKVEEALIEVLKRYGITTTRDQRNPGVWMGNKKIASLGFHLHRGITTHGFALNVANDLTPFSYFIPCGIESAGVTNILEAASKNYSLEDVAEDLCSDLKKVMSLT